MNKNNINYDTPRIIVMHEWPGMPDNLKVGDVLIHDGMTSRPDYYKKYKVNGQTEYALISASEVDRTIESGSNVLRILEWYECRVPEELPEYVKEKGILYKVNNWDFKGKSATVFLSHTKYGFYPHNIGYSIKPATSTEYETYMQSLNQPVQNG